MTRRRVQGILPLLVALLVLSAMMRLGGVAEQAMATGSAPQGTAVVPGAACPDDAQLSAMLAAFRQRDADLSAREAQIADRIQALKVAQAQVDDRIAALDAAKAALEATLAVAQTAAEKDLGQLTTVYENMKPKDAAAVFEQMDPAFAAGFLGRMRPDAAAAVMAGLQPDTAYAVSVILAGRNAAAPTH
ncbi:MAG: hypothetical protein GC146_09015 [Limimaricola sp.]|uniref:MotE family protein n=1 Tax=Limimaricola sp. TaxID=2211665 RepID=UPI001D58C7B7|nr:hypothetical protein [Limimaricola sp.]MBI1417349.1 hypothetical protein [Limimaricola sp.]